MQLIQDVVTWALVMVIVTPFIFIGAIMIVALIGFIKEIFSAENS